MGHHHSLPGVSEVCCAGSFAEEDVKGKSRVVEEVDAEDDEGVQQNGLKNGKSSAMDVDNEEEESSTEMEASSSVTVNGAGNGKTQDEGKNGVKDEEDKDVQESSESDEGDVEDDDSPKRPMRTRGAERKKEVEKDEVVLDDKHEAPDSAEILSLTPDIFIVDEGQRPIWGPLGRVRQFLEIVLVESSSVVLTVALHSKSNASHCVCVALPCYVMDFRCITLDCS